MESNKVPGAAIKQKLYVIQCQQYYAVWPLVTDKGHLGGRLTVKAWKGTPY